MAVSCLEPPENRVITVISNYCEKSCSRDKFAVIAEWILICFINNIHLFLKKSKVYFPLLIIKDTKAHNYILTTPVLCPIIIFLLTSLLIDDILRELGVGSWELRVESWELRVGSWELGVGS